MLISEQRLRRIIRDLLKENEKHSIVNEYSIKSFSIPPDIPLEKERRGDGGSNTVYVTYFHDLERYSFNFPEKNERNAEDVYYKDPAESDENHFFFDEKEILDDANRSERDVHDYLIDRRVQALMTEYSKVGGIDKIVVCTPESECHEPLSFKQFIEANALLKGDNIAEIEWFAKSTLGKKLLETFRDLLKSKIYCDYIDLRQSYTLFYINTRTIEDLDIFNFSPKEIDYSVFEDILSDIIADYDLSYDIDFKKKDHDEEYNEIIDEEYNDETYLYYTRKMRDFIRKLDPKPTF